MNKFLKQFKNIFSNGIFRILLVSIATVIVTLLIIILFAWYYREKIFNYISRNYIPQQQVINTDILPLSIENEQENISQAPITDEKVASTVVDAVKKAKPAVVSIVVSKQIPKYSVTYKEQSILDGNGNPISGLSITSPVYTPNGTEKKQLGSGSGFLISSDGLVVTNRHVVERTDVDYTILLNNGKEYTATVLARDSVLDIAIIKIIASNLPYLEFGDSDQLEVGESVIAIGNALGEFKNTVSVGVVSGLSRSITAGDSLGQSEKLDKVIQTDAAINPGNSGGPLLNLEGRVVGINVAIAQGSSSVGFSLPINSVKTVIDQVKKTGKISRPYVGVRYVNVTEDIKAKYNLLVDHGILVQRGVSSADVAIVPGSPAEKAGIQEGDVILSVNGTLLNKDNDFISIIRSKNIGETIKLRVLSMGVERTVSLKLEGTTE